MAERRVGRWFPPALAAVVGASLAVRLTHGVGFLLDDFYFLRRWQRGDSLLDFGTGGGDRPVGSLIVGGLLQVMGDRPVPFFVLMALMTAVVAVLIARLLAPVVGASLAGITALVWAWLPSHSSLEAWPSTLPISVALAAGLGALLVVSAPGVGPMRIGAGCVLVALATLAYESAGLFTVIGLAGIQLLRERRLQARPLVPVAVVAGACLGWSALHWPAARNPTGEVQDVSLVLPANLGWGIAPPGPAAAAVAVLAAAGAVMCLWAAHQQRWQRSDARLVLAGLTVMLLGSGPYLLYVYQPFGVGDRFNYVSSIGGALVWVGIGAWALERLPRPVALAGLAAVSALTFGGRLHESRLWSAASADAGRVGQQLASTRVDDGDGGATLVVLSPGGIPSQEAIGPFFDLANVRAATAYHLDRDDVVVEQAASDDAFNRASLDPAVLTVDIAGGSGLRP